MAKIHRVDQTFSLEQITSLPQERIQRDWFGDPPHCDISFVVACSETHLFFGGEVASLARYEPNLHSGQFVEGLWNQDVLELFVGIQNSSAYLELNLAPSGAWWCCYFDNYRQRSTRQSNSPRAQILLGKNEQVWRAALAFPLSQIEDKINTNTIVFCTILGDPRRFYTNVHPPPTTPDFHALLT